MAIGDLLTDIAGNLRVDASGDFLAKVGPSPSGDCEPCCDDECASEETAICPICNAADPTATPQFLDILISGVDSTACGCTNCTLLGSYRIDRLAVDGLHRVQQVAPCVWRLVIINAIDFSTYLLPGCNLLQVFGTSDIVLTVTKVAGGWDISLSTTGALTVLIGGIDVFIGTAPDGPAPVCASPSGVAANTVSCGCTLVLGFVILGGADGSTGGAARVFPCLNEDEQCNECTRCVRQPSPVKICGGAPTLCPPVPAPCCTPKRILATVALQCCGFEDCYDCDFDDKIVTDLVCDAPTGSFEMVLNQNIDDCPVLSIDCVATLTPGSGFPVCERAGQSVCVWTADIGGSASWTLWDCQDECDCDDFDPAIGECTDPPGHECDQSAASITSFRVFLFLFDAEISPGMFQQFWGCTVWSNDGPNHSSGAGMQLYGIAPYTGCDVVPPIRLFGCPECGEFETCNSDDFVVLEAGTVSFIVCPP